MRKINIIWLGLGLLLCGCNAPVNKDEAEKCAEGFANAFFVLDFNRAKDYCTTSSERWLKFYVSNIRQSDADSIRALPDRPEVSIDKLKKGKNDSLAVCTCTVKGAFIMDRLGEAGHRVEKAQMMLQLVRQNGQWKIKLEGLPRNEKK